MLMMTTSAMISKHGSITSSLHPKCHSASWTYWRSCGSTLPSTRSHIGQPHSGDERHIHAVKRAGRLPIHGDLESIDTLTVWDLRQDRKRNMRGIVAYTISGQPHLLLCLWDLAYLHVLVIWLPRLCIYSSTILAYMLIEHHDQICADQVSIR